MSSACKYRQSFCNPQISGKKNKTTAYFCRFTASSPATGPGAAPLRGVDNPANPPSIRAVRTGSGGPPGRRQQQPPLSFQFPRHSFQRLGEPLLPVRSRPQPSPQTSRITSRRAAEPPSFPAARSTLRLRALRERPQSQSTPKPHAERRRAAEGFASACQRQPSASESRRQRATNFFPPRI